MSVVSSVRPICAAVLLHDPLRRRLVRGGRRRGGQLGEHLGAALAADLDQEAVPAVVEQLGEREVEARGRRGPGVHRHAEAGRRRPCRS